MRSTKYFVAFAIGLLVSFSPLFNAYAQGPVSFQILNRSVSERIGQAAQAFTTCEVHVDDPHESAHFPGTVNVEAKVKCEGPVPHIEMVILLIREGRVIVTKKSENWGYSSLKSNVVTPCVTGTYQGGIAATVTPSLDGPPKNFTLIGGH